MKTHAIAIAALATCFLAFDAVWLGVISVSFYQEAIGHLLAPKPDFVPAVFFYVIYLAGTYYFAVRPALEKRKVMSALLSGALLGFVAYATYDLTNAATLRDWPVLMTVIDLVWGTALTGVSAAVAAFAGLKFSRK